jgi:hypothetical protein
MKQILALTIILAACTLQACRFGPTVENFPPAHTPKGISGHVMTSRGNYTAELIEVRGDGIVILEAQTFRLIPYTAVVSARFDGIPQTISSGHAPSRKGHERLRLVSRFPQGLTPELLLQLLAANGQKDLAAENR